MLASAALEAEGELADRMRAAVVLGIAVQPVLQFTNITAREPTKIYFFDKAFLIFLEWTSGRTNETFRETGTMTLQTLKLCAPSVLFMHIDMCM